jgi:hypothetical protein
MTRPSPADYAEYRYIRANDVRYLPPNRHAQGRTVKSRIKTFLADGVSRARPAHGAGPRPVGLGVGKRRWYATIFSFDRPRSRSTSTERRGRSLSRAGATPRSSSPWLPSCQPLVFTRATSVFTPAVPPLSHQYSAVSSNSHSLCGRTARV